MVVQQNIHEAKTHFSRLIARVLQGDRVIIAKGGMPVAEIVPFVGEKKPRTPGSARGLITMSDDFDAPLPDEILDAFES